MATEKKSKSNLPIMTHEERMLGARGFFIVNLANPLPASATTYLIKVNAAAVINGYSERKSRGAGQDDMLTARNLAGITLAIGTTIAPPRRNPAYGLTVASGELICYLEDDIL